MALALGALAASAWLAMRGISSGSVLLAGTGIAALLSAGLVSAALVQRLRFRRLADQGGLVEVDEREIRYFGVEGCAVLSLDHLDRIDIRGSEAFGNCCVLHRSATGMQPVTIPVTARGADRLFDAFAALPGISLARLVSVSRQAAGETLTIWERARESRLDSHGRN